MIHDNVNFPNRVGQHTLRNHDRFISATSGSLGVLQREYKIGSTDLKYGKATDLDETDFCNDELSEHWHKVKRAHIFSVLKQQFPEAVKRLSEGRDILMVPPCHVLKI